MDSDLRHKPLRDTVLRSTFVKDIHNDFVGYTQEFCDFEESKLVKTWFDVTSMKIEEEYDNCLKVNFEI